MRDACEQCGNVVGGRSLIFVHVFSWSCVHLSRHCVDCVGYGLYAIVIVQQHGLCVVPFVVHSSVWCHSTEKTVGASGVPSMQDVEKALPATRLWQAGRSSQFAATPPVSKNALATAPNVVCTTCERCSEVLAHLLQAVTGQQDNTRPPLNVFVAQVEDSGQSDLRRGSMNHSCSQITRTEHQTHAPKQ